jgi:hypothetical protein
MLGSDLNDWLVAILTIGHSIEFPINQAVISVTLVETPMINSSTASQGLFFTSEMARFHFPLLALRQRA